MGWGVGGWGWGVVGWCPHTHVHAHTCMHAHACTCMCGKHDNFMQMAGPHCGDPWEFPMMSYTCVHVCMCMHVHVCTCVGGTLSSPPPPSIHPQPPESVKIQ